MNNYVVILAGGVGSRFWPASTEENPKQFLDMLGVGKSLLRLTYERFLRIIDSERIYVITNEKYRRLVKEHIPELSDQQVIGEPSRNNTGPCVALASLKVAKLNKNANLVIAPADHFIAHEDDFERVIVDSLAFTASGNHILTLGMRPHRPDTGYGYIELGDRLPGESPVHKAAAFKEKPDLHTAKEYLHSGQYMWNSGIFIFSTTTVLSAFAKHAPGIYEVLTEGMEHLNTSSEQEFLAAKYPTTPSISIDYAIMEAAENVYCFPADFGWTDLGTWGSLYDFKREQTDENISINAQYFTEDGSGNLVVSQDIKQIITDGLHDYLIIDYNSSLLIFPRAKEQEIKNLVHKLSNHSTE